MEDNFKLRPHTEIPERRENSNSRYSPEIFIIDEDDDKDIIFYDFKDNHWCSYRNVHINEMTFVWFYGPERESS